VNRCPEDNAPDSFFADFHALARQNPVVDSAYIGEANQAAAFEPRHHEADLVHVRRDHYPQVALARALFDGGSLPRVDANIAGVTFNRLDSRERVFARNAQFRVPSAAFSVPPPLPSQSPPGSPHPARR
jgi:hypothetical protein